MDVLEGVLESADGKETGEQLVERLQQVAILDLQSMYCRVLFKAYPSDEIVANFKTCIGIMLVAQASLSAGVVHEILLCSISRARLTKRQVVKTFNLLNSLLKTDKNGNLSFIHNSVVDYLFAVGCNSNCAGEYSWDCSCYCCHNRASSTFQIDFKSVSQDMAHGCLNILNASLSQNMARLSISVTYGTSSFRESSFEAQQSLIPTLHMFCQTKLPMYLEALVLLGSVDVVSGVVSSIDHCLEEHSSRFRLDGVDFIKSILADLKYVSTTFSQQLLSHPLEVYQDALGNVPPESSYFQTYGHLEIKKQN
ncbi:UNVERIFIED_CONTAM: hypothetical protein HDU68_000468 [Siphonaria sp. JEL0065]|nr:hypothetical protein HDU68_000468 [Siphonaria sp. JEL0065]